MLDKRPFVSPQSLPIVYEEVSSSVHRVSRKFRKADKFFIANNFPEWIITGWARHIVEKKRITSYFSVSYRWAKWVKIKLLSLVYIASVFPLFDLKAYVGLWKTNESVAHIFLLSVVDNAKERMNWPFLELVFNEGFQFCFYEILSWVAKPKEAESRP